MRKFGKHTTPPSRAVERAVRFACAAGGVAAACLLLLLTITTPQAQAGDNPVAGSGQTGIDRPLTADRPGEYPLDRGTTGSGADFGAPASTPLLRGTPKAGSGDPNRLGAQGSPYRSESSGRLRGPGLEGNSITGGSVTRD